MTGKKTRKTMNHSELIELLLSSGEPTLEDEVKNSSRVKDLLQKVDSTGILRNERGVYDKWQGTHWVLMTLADIGYPQRDDALQPLADDLLNTWLGKRAFNEFVAEKKSDAYKQRDAIPVMQGRHRTCASQQGNTLYSILKLGLEDDRVHQLAERLRYWQWPDGGWNCDKNPDAKTSTFIHTLYSMRALAMYAERTGDEESEKSALRASEVMLKRNLYKRVSDGQIIKPEFVKLHYPLYWHYDILGALKVFAEIGQTEDERFDDALDLLEAKELLTGGWPAEGRYYKKVSGDYALYADYVSWSGVSKKKLNPWVTADALTVLMHFGRLTVTRS